VKGLNGGLMSEAKHDLAAEFPEFKEAIHELKMSNSHFLKLFDRYHELNRSIHRAEQRIDALSEFEEEKLRKQRLVVKDELYKILTSHKK